MWSPMQAEIQQGDMEMECIIPGTVQQGKTTHKNRHVHEFLW